MLNTHHKKNVLTATMPDRVLFWRIGVSLCAALLLMALLPPVHAASEEGEVPEEGKLAIDMEPFDFPLFDRGRTIGRVNLILTLVVQEQRDSELIRLHMPQVRADFLSALATLSRQRFKINKPIDPDIVRAYLTPFLNYRLGEGKVDVFVKQAVIKPA